MTAFLHEAPSINGFQARLDGTLDASSNTIALDSTSGLVAPGVVCIDRIDGSNNDTPNKREYVTFTGISSNVLTGVVRGVLSTAQSHSSGSIVEASPTVTHWGDLVDFLRVEHSASGGHVISTATINYTETKNLAVTSMASIAALDIGVRLNASGASLTGLGIGQTAVFSFAGSLSGPTTSIQTPLIMPEGGSVQWVTFLTRTTASGVSAIIDINKNGTSIFDSVGRPMISAGGTLVSTASIAVKSFNRGDSFNWDYDGQGGIITDFNIILRSE
jgi:hypothetical protein